MPRLSLIEEQTRGLKFYRRRDGFGLPRIQPWEVHARYWTTHANPHGQCRCPVANGRWGSLMSELGKNCLRKHKLIVNARNNVNRIYEDEIVDRPGIGDDDNHFASMRASD